MGGLAGSLIRGRHRGRARSWRGSVDYVRKKVLRMVMGARCVGGMGEVMVGGGMYT